MLCWGGLSVSVLRDYLSRMAQMRDEMCDLDRDRNRVSQFVQHMNLTLKAYKELYNEYVNKAQQRSITYYLSRVPPPPPPPAVEMDADIPDEELDAILEDDDDVTSTFSGFDDVQGDDDESSDSPSTPQ